MDPKEGTMPEPLNSGDICTRLQRIAELARQHPERAFRSIQHVIDLDFLRAAYGRTRKDGAVGVDGQSGTDYATHLDENLQDLLDRFKTGSYYAPPVRRVEIPKEGSDQKRLIGIPTFEDKVLQQAVAMVLGAIYEQDFLDCSFGFRPKRSQHQALESLRDAMMTLGGGWVLEVDIQKYFDTLDHKQLRAFLDQRVTDGVLRRTIHKWLKAGIMTDEVVRRSETGTPQGGVVSPILANVYLHYVLDVWFEQEVKPRLKGRVHLVRFADDVVMVFSHRPDALQVLEVLPKRLGKHGLTLHPDKTRLVPFRRPRRTPDDPDDGPRPGSFDFLGFTHFWARSRRGKWVVKQKTAKTRLARAVKRIALWCKANRHESLKDQQHMLTLKMRGHYNYYGITGNHMALEHFHRATLRCWRKWLGRRSNSARKPWSWWNRLLARLPLPKPRSYHSAYRLPANP
jgi:group II intron reverse transcriptase/maturase